MSSKREEERNEKIIRGLMKLPPNRRCINCNSLGPQYVCTNFWTFVCITCSGIQKCTFSMAKFTSQEVDALQSGGNQRARELFLRAWDPEKNRLPDVSNIDKVRDFIKKVYVDRLYFQEKSTDRPPRDPQSLRNHEDQTRRASSYHSYSQSPPYDFQYEERRYGKHGPALTRKPGSDRGLYEGKLASFLSPTRPSDHANDERFANEGSQPRFSEYSVSGGGDPFRSGGLSPSSQRDTGSPSSETSREILNEAPQLHKILQISDANNTSNEGKILHPQVKFLFCRLRIW
ncbi:putative ADP-ribosylation factor GTPase-activating protein agd14 [Orobanche hederae]